jgi:hypothetical protein
VLTAAPGETDNWGMMAKGFGLVTDGSYEVDKRMPYHLDFAELGFDWIEKRLNQGTSSPASSCSAKD